MIDFLVYLLGIILTAQAVLGLAFLISCIWEREKRATFFGGLQLLCMAGLVIIVFLLKADGFFETDTGNGFLIIGYIIVVLVALAMLLRLGVNPRAKEGTRGLIVSAVKRVNPRFNIFRGPESEPGKGGNRSPRSERREGPEGRQIGPTIDDPYDGPNLAAVHASRNFRTHFKNMDAIKPKTSPAMKGKKIDLTPEQASIRVKGYARSMGAALVGITKLNPLWVYSHNLNSMKEGLDGMDEEISVDHPYAVVMATEMNLDLISAAPHTSTLMTSMENYAKGTFISTQLAAFIANLGYSATANSYLYYETLLVPLAIDAGLGELGRFGILMTKELGPRLRLSCVTTDLPLVPDEPVDIGVGDFCNVCKKCAICCPSHSIPMGDREDFNGVLKWKLNAETCAAYWRKVGTDCGVCIRVCPWSHSKTFPHKVLIELISRNKVARRVFNVMDDIFYGKRPKPKAGPQWAQYKPVK